MDMEVVCKLFILCLILPLSRADNCSETKDVHSYVRCGYNRNVRPVKNVEDQVVVKVEMYLISLDDFDLKSQTVGSRLFLKIVWRDEYLVWEPSQFNNTTRISMDSSQIWIPDLNIGNDEGPFTFIEYPMIGRATVGSDGIVVIWPYFGIEIGCDVEIVYYPFDKQSFYFRVGSWSFTTKDILLEFLTPKFNLKKYTENGEWDITGHFLKAHNHSFDGDYYSRVEYHITIQRKPLYYILNIIAPVVVTSFLNIMCFILPVESAERVTFSTSIFLTMAVFLTIVSQSLPKTSDGVSVTFVYICLQLFGSFCTIIMNVLVLDIYHRKSDNSVFAKCLRATILSRRNRIKRANEAEPLQKTEHDYELNPGAGQLESMDIEPSTEVVTETTKLELHETLTKIHEQANGDKPDDTSEVALALNSVCLAMALSWNVALILFLSIYVNT